MKVMTTQAVASTSVLDLIGRTPLLRFDRHLAGFCRITSAVATALAPPVEVEAEPVAQAV